MSTTFCFEFFSQVDRWISHVIFVTLVLTAIYGVYSSIRTIYKFYCPEKLPTILKIGSIVATIILTLCQLFLVVICISRYKCYPLGYYVLGPIYTVLYAISYLLLFTMFSIKVDSSTKDSIYRLSNRFICFLIILAILFTILVALIILFLNTNQYALGNICVQFAFIINCILYISLLFKLLSTLFYVFKTTIILSNVNLKSSDEWISVFNQIFEAKLNDNINININSRRLTLNGTRTISSNSSKTNCNLNNNNNNINNNNKSYDNNLDMDKSLMKALGIARIMIRITVCVSMVFVSNIIVLISLVSINVLSLHQNGSVMTLLHLIYSIDLMVNNICLLYQYQFAQKSYDKNCKLSNKFLKNVVFYTIETNMKTIQTNQNIK